MPQPEMTLESTEHVRPGIVSPHLRRLIATGALIGAMLSGAIAPSVAAQDGTGGVAFVQESACAIPLAAETYDADEATPEIATPVATPEATPIAGEEPEEATDPLLDDLAESASTIAACLTEGDADVLAEMTSDTYRGQLIGSEEPLAAEVFASILPTLPEATYTIHTIEDATLENDAVATATVTYQIANQLRTGAWEFERTDTSAGEAWTLAQEIPQDADAADDATTIDVTIGDLAYDLSETTVDAGAVEMEVSNTAETDHEVLLLQLTGEATTADIVQSPGPDLPEGVIFAGQITVPAGTDGTMVLADLEPGTYALVDLFPQADGTTNLSNGMEATLTVE